MAKFNLAEYDTVESRLVKFWKKYPDGAVETEMLHYDDRRIVIKASVFTKAGDHTAPWATGIAEESRGDGFVNKNNHVENCDTSAVGRALANIGFSGSKRPSREEMTKASKEDCTPEQKAKLIELAVAAGMDTDEATIKADAMDASLYPVAVKQLKEKANA